MLARTTVTSGHRCHGLPQRGESYAELPGGVARHDALDVSVLARHVDRRASGIEDRHALDQEDLIGLVRREVVLD